MPSSFPLSHSVVGCLLLLALPLVCPLAHGQSTGQQLSPQQVEQLVNQLNSARFVERERATQQLIEAGDVSINSLVKHLPDASPEGVARGVYVLTELVLGTEAETSQRSWTAIEQLAANQNGSLARRAADSLEVLHTARKARARETLVKNGAIISDRHGQIGGMIVSMVYSVEIPETFQGKLEDFKQIKWLDDVRQVTLQGEQVNNQWLQPLADLKALVAVEVKHSKVTDAGLKHLQELPNLQYLSVYYSPVTNDALETIKSIKTLGEIRLFGTQITTEGATQLQQALKLANVDHRHGAFLGVGCQTHPDGAQITIMHEESAAEQAGLRSGDVIQRFNDTPVANFEELKNAIAKHPAGEEVSIKVLRGERPMQFKVKLGEWE